MTCCVVCNRRIVLSKLQEWTALLQPCHFLAFAAATNGLHRKVFERSIGLVTAASLEPGDTLALFPAACLERGPAEQQAFVDSLSWHELNGRRVNYIARNVMQPTEELRIHLAALLVGAEEDVSFYFFSRAAVRASCDDRQEVVLPAMMHFAYAPSNPALGLCQFLSAMLAGRHPALAILLASRGARSVPQLIAQDPVAAHEIRTAMVAAATAAYLRHWQRWTRWPWKLCLVANPEAPEAVAQQVAQDFMDGCPTCVDLAFGRVLRARIFHASDLFKLEWQEANSCHYFKIL